MKDDKTLYWIWLSERCGAASREFGRLVAHYDDPYELYRMDDEEIEHLECIGKGLKERLCNKSLEKAYSILKVCQKEKADIISYADPRYPARLRSIQDPPVLLYCLGSFPDMNTRLCIGMVGTRKMSEYGMQTAYGISYELASAGVVVVSGMALGIDGVCACGALEAGGDTVAVLGCGISVAYPREHKKLMETIAKRGAVISEYPPTEEPRGYNFPKRNRIISGICQGTLVVEGAVGSGSLITASYAISQGREVFALPGKVNESNSEGPNQLIREGARVALSSNDILNYYNFLYSDVIEREAYLRSKNESAVSERSLEKYGITWAKYRGRYKKADVLNSDESNAVSVKNKGTLNKGPNEVKMREQPSAEPQAKTVREDSDRSQRVLASLDDTSRKVFEYMPLNNAVTPDVIAERGIDIGDVITALTLLELAELVSSLPGGTYIRK